MATLGAGPDGFTAAVLPAADDAAAGEAAGEADAEGELAAAGDVAGLAASAGFDAVGEAGVADEQAAVTNAARITAPMGRIDLITIFSLHPLRGWLTRPGLRAQA